MKICFFHNHSNSKSGQHHRVYNNFLRLDDGEWVFVDNESRLVLHALPEAFAVGEEGIFEKVEGVTFVKIGEKKWEVQGGGEVRNVLGGFWQTLVNRRNIPDAFFFLRGLSRMSTVGKWTPCVRRGGGRFHDFFARVLGRHCRHTRKVFEDNCIVPVPESVVDFVPKRMPGDGAATEGGALYMVTRHLDWQSKPMELREFNRSGADDGGDEEYALADNRNNRSLATQALNTCSSCNSFLRTTRGYTLVLLLLTTICLFADQNIMAPNNTR